MHRNIKTEPERPKWTLIAVSEAARKWRPMIQLDPNKTYSVGRKRENNIQIPSRLCSKSHCTLQVTESEIIMKDQSLYGTRVNHINYRDSRCILSQYDLIGFGCSPTARRVKDKSDTRCYVYRVALGSAFNSSETIELSDGSDNEGEPYDASDGLDVGNETDEDCSSADEEEPDVKPDIHTLMRVAMETMQIKQEVEGYCYDYERSQWTDKPDPTIVNEEAICLDSEDEEKEDILLLEPPRKRVRQVEPEYSFPTPEPEPEPKSDPKEEDDSNSEQTLPEYQMSDTTRKEKVKLVTRSRGQQLATDMLKTQKTLFKGAGPSHQEANTPASVNQTYKPPSEYSNYSIADLSNVFISEITKWDYQWIQKKNPNPLRYQMDVKPLDTNFTDLASFQRQMKNLLLMEIYSIIYMQCTTTKIPHTFTRVEALRFDEGRQRHIIKCETLDKDMKSHSEIKPGFCTVFAHSKGKALGYVSQVKRTTVGWEYEMQTAGVKKPFQPKCVQVEFVANIQPMLECFVSLYELEKSSLQDVFLCPSSQYEDVNSSINTNFAEKDSFQGILDKIYERCAVSIFGNSQILLVNGGAGSGKTNFICNLLERFESEDFQFSKSILVCGRRNALVDEMAARILPKINNIARFGPVSTPQLKNRLSSIGVDIRGDLKKNLKDKKIVFTTLSNAFDLLHAERAFDVCIVDDASLCSEVELLPLFRLKLTTLLLFGDEKLQTSTTQNECCHENGYSRSLFNRAIASYKQIDSKRILYPTLYKQQRMLKEICSWPNKYFYENRMEIVPIVRPKRTPFQPYTVFQVNTIADEEVEFVREMLKLLCADMNSKRCSCGIICGHPESRAEIESMIKSHPQFTGVEVSGYESFQGQEKDVILMVALKPKDGFKLFSTKENLLIALTRAKESLIFCGNFQYICTDLSADIYAEANSMTNTWKALLDDAKARKRFFDLNGAFNQAIVSKSLK